MIWKLRWRFIGIAMLAFSLVVALIAFLTNVTYVYYVARINDATIESIVRSEVYRSKFKALYTIQLDQNPSPVPFNPFPSDEDDYVTRFFIVSINRETDEPEVFLEQIASITHLEASSYTYKALHSKGDRGYINGYRYIVFTTDEDVIIIFLNCDKELPMVSSIRWMTILISSLSLFLVFFLVLLFSDRVIQPYAKNIEAQKRFITDASHELKTPLTSISTSIEVIEMDRGSDEWTDNIRQQVARMTGLVSEMVSLSRLDEFKAPVKEQFDLSSAAWETLEYHIPQAKGCGKEIKTDIQEKVTFTGEKSSIQQMLSVLIENAIKYSTEKSEIRFNLKKSHGKVKIVVYNPCNYENPPDVKRIFDRFYRPDESRNASTGGNGIGLAIAKSVAEAHNGSISASCPDGKSMTITVEM